MHHIAPPPTVLPWSAATLILLLTLHLYQRGSNFTAISTVHTPGLRTWLRLSKKSADGARRGWSCRWLIRAPYKDGNTLTADILSPLVFTQSGHRTLQRCMLTWDHQSPFFLLPLLPGQSGSKNTHVREGHYDFNLIIFDVLRFSQQKQHREVGGHLEPWSDKKNKKKSKQCQPSLWSRVVNRGESMGQGEQDGMEGKLHHFALEQRYF